MEEKKKSGLATAGLVLGIVGACLSFIPIVNNVAFFLGALALIFGAICLFKKASLGKAVAALVLGILAIVITIAMQSAAAKAIDEISEEIKSSGFSALDEGTVAAVKAPEKDADEVVYTVGDTAVTGISKITLTDARINNGNGLFKPDSGKVYLILDFEVENTSDDDITVSSILSFSAYCDDYESSMSIGAISSEDKDSIDGTAAPGKKVAGVIGYEVPEDFKVFEVRYSPSLLSNEKVMFTVKGIEQ